MSYIEDMLSHVEEDSVNTPGLPRSTPILDFYKGSNVFITGGTGFLGRVLIEKLLRSSPDLEAIYLLVRPKKGKDMSSRMDTIFDDALFYKVSKQSPKFRHKIKLVAGDCSLPGLGLSTDDRQQLIQDVDIVFHVAATVRFDEKLRSAVAINVIATKDILTLCKQMPKIKAVVHVSTAYCNCHISDIDEKFYDPPMPHEKMCSLVDSCTDRMLEEITPLVLGKWPNTYALTKAVAENIVKRESEDLPIVVFRPAIVIATNEEPIAGWIDSLYGPTGVVFGAGNGVLKTLHCDPETLADVVPVDMVVNAMIASAWDISQTSRACRETPIYNYVSSCEKPLRWKNFCSLIEVHGLAVPSVQAIWYYSLTLNKYYWVHWMYTLFLHFLPALFVDAALSLQGKTPKLWNVYKKINKFSNVISYFSTKTWTFHNDNVQSLWNRVSPEDQTIFMFNMKDLDWCLYFYNYIRGCRVFLAKDELSTIPEAMVRWRRLYWLHQAVKTICSLVILRIMWAVVSNVYSLIAS